MEQTGKTAGTRATANKNQALNQNNGSKTETHPYKKNNMKSRITGSK